MRARPVCRSCLPPQQPHRAPGHCHGKSLGQNINLEQTPNTLSLGMGQPRAMPSWETAWGHEEGLGLQQGSPKNQNILRVSRDTCWRFPEAASSSAPIPHPSAPLLRSHFLSVLVAGQSFFYILNYESVLRLYLLLSIFFTLTI